MFVLPGFCAKMICKVGNFAPHHSLQGVGYREHGSILQMWWLIVSAPDFWGGGLVFESGIYTTMLLVRCRIIVKYSRTSQGRDGNLPLWQNKD